MHVNYSNVLSGAHEAQEVSVVEAIAALAPRNVSEFTFTKNPYEAVDAVGLDANGKAVVGFEIKYRQSRACTFIRLDESLFIDHKKVSRVADFSARHGGIPVYSAQYLPDRDEIVVHLLARDGEPVDYQTKTVSTRTTSYLGTTSATKPLSILPLDEAFVIAPANIRAA